MSGRETFTVKQASTISTVKQAAKTIFTISTVGQAVKTIATVEQAASSINTRAERTARRLCPHRCASCKKVGYVQSWEPQSKLLNVDIHYKKVIQGSNRNEYCAFICKPVKSVDMHRSMIGPHDWPHREGSGWLLLSAQQCQTGLLRPPRCPWAPPAAGLLSRS